ncbi:MAG: YwbE family protein, partial [Smithella sp.]
MIKCTCPDFPYFPVIVYHNNFLRTDSMFGNNRTDIRVGSRVKVVQKQDQRSGTLTEGVVRDILTKSATHPHGIKVRLESGIVG